jgi:hypothetical protein
VWWNVISHNLSTKQNEKGKGVTPSPSLLFGWEVRGSFHY